MEAYYHANKALPWSLAVGTIAASWYGGNGTIGTVGYVTTMGLSAFFIWSIGAHLVRFPLALWVAPRISVKVNSTMTELLDRFYGRIASFIGAIVLLATCLSISEIGACGYVGVAAWNMNKFLAAAIVIAISIGAFLRWRPARRRHHRYDLLLPDDRICRFCLPSARSTAWAASLLSTRSSARLIPR